MAFLDTGAPFVADDQPILQEEDLPVSAAPAPRVSLARFVVPAALVAAVVCVALSKRPVFGASAGVRGADFEGLVTMDEEGFDPHNPLTTYRDIGNCGPRGNDAQADEGSCPGGTTKIHQSRYEGEGLVTIDDCVYKDYKIYECDGDTTEWCEDKHDQCDTWAKESRCVNNAHDMNLNEECPKACGMCDWENSVAKQYPSQFPWSGSARLYFVPAEETMAQLEDIGVVFGVHYAGGIWGGPHVTFGYYVHYDDFGRDDRHGQVVAAAEALKELNMNDAEINFYAKKGGDSFGVNLGKECPGKYLVAAGDAAKDAGWEHEIKDSGFHMVLHIGEEAAKAAGNDYGRRRRRRNATGRAIVKTLHEGEWGFVLAKKIGHEEFEFDWRSYVRATGPTPATETDQ